MQEVHVFEISQLPSQFNAGEETCRTYYEVVMRFATIRFPLQVGDA